MCRELEGQKKHDDRYWDLNSYCSNPKDGVFLEGVQEFTASLLSPESLLKWHNSDKNLCI